MLSNAVRWVLRLAVPALVLGGILALVRQPIGHSPREGMLRLIGRMVGARVNVCRTLTAEELAKIPKHMQRGGQVCEQSLLPYHLQVWLDGRLRIDEVARPAGIRADRPVYVQQELLLPPGTYQLRIRLAPGSGSGPEPAGSESGPAQRAVAQAMAAAANFDLDQSIDLRAGQVFLVELDESGRRWITHVNEP